MNRNDFNSEFLAEWNGDDKRGGDGKKLDAAQGAELIKKLDDLLDKHGLVIAKVVG